MQQQRSYKVQSIFAGTESVSELVTTVEFTQEGFAIVLVIVKLSCALSSQKFTQSVWGVDLYCCGVLKC